MKKSLLALSILGAFAGVAQAQTNVTMYGIADVGVSREEASSANGTKQKITRVDSGGYSGSRLGFTGTEDLGNGLKALFTLETGLNLDTGGFGQAQKNAAGVSNGGTAFGRQAFVGLGGNFGTVKLGRQQTFLFYGQAAIDPFGIGLAGDSTKFFSGPFRVNNTIKYESPSISGFTGGYSHSFGEDVNGASNGADNAFSGQYANGPLFLSAIYDQQNSSPAAGAQNFKTKVTNIGGTYDFGVAKAHLMFDRVRNDLGASSRDYLIGTTIPFGAGNFLLDYIKHTDKANANSDAKQYAIGYTYALSKRTTLYTSYSRTNGDANYNISSSAFIGTTPALNGNSDKLFDFGVRHSF